MERGLRMLSQVENQFASQRLSQAAVDHKAVYAKTLRMMNSHYQNCFSLDDEPASVRDAYGKGSFGSGCLMARRLVEQGVSYVEVNLDGWDTHTNNFDTLSRRLLPELDKGMSALVADLARRHLLATTTIVGWVSSAARPASTRTRAAITGPAVGRSSSVAAARRAASSSARPTRTELTSSTVRRASWI